MFKRGQEAFLVMEMRLKDCERKLSMAEGRLRVLEGFSNALVTSTSDPHATRTIWSIAMPIVTDEQALRCEGRSDEYRDGMAQALQFLAQRIDALPESSCDPLIGPEPHLRAL